MKKFLIGGFVAALLIISPQAGVAQTATVEALQAQIQSLLQTIQTLQAQLVEIQQSQNSQSGSTGSTTTSTAVTSGTVSTTAQCVSFENSLYFGRRDSTTGGEVSKLQEFLQSAGDYTYPRITGYFGSATEAAVKSWQVRNGVISSATSGAAGYGIVGPKTREKIASVSCGTEIKTITVAPRSVTPVVSSPAASSSITVLSPNGGEVLTAGSSYPITWTTSNLPSNHNLKLRIDLTKAGSDTGLPWDESGLTGFVDINQTSRSWSIPQDLPAGTYRLSIIVADFTAHPEGSIIAKDFSNFNFTIESASLPDSVNPAITQNDFLLGVAEQTGLRLQTTRTISNSNGYSYDQNFDWDNDGDIDFADLFSARDKFQKLGLTQYTSVIIPKLYAIMDARLGVSKGNSNYISVFDLNQNGVINATDRTILRGGFLNQTFVAQVSAITVLSPKAGETYLQGTDQTVSWIKFDGDFVGYTMNLANKLAPGYSESFLPKGQSNILISKDKTSATINGLEISDNLIKAWMTNTGGAIKEEDLRKNFYIVVQAERSLTGKSDIAASGNSGTISIEKKSDPLLIPASAEIIGSQSSYLPGQDVSFSVKGATSDGSVPTPQKGFHVQAWIYDGSNVAQVDGIYQAVNALYNSNTGHWDVTMKAPRDISKTYKAEGVFYCSNPAAGCSDEVQIPKSFSFTLQPSITVLSPATGATLTKGQNSVIKWSDDVSDFSDLFVELRLKKNGSDIGRIGQRFSFDSVGGRNRQHEWSVKNYESNQGVWTDTAAGSGYSIEVQYIKNNAILSKSTGGQFSIANPADNCRYDGSNGANIGNVYTESQSVCHSYWDSFGSTRPGSKTYYNGTLIRTYESTTAAITQDDFFYGVAEQTGLRISTNSTTAPMNSNGYSYDPNFDWDNDTDIDFLDLFTARDYFSKIDDTTYANVIVPKLYAILDARLNVATGASNFIGVFDLNQNGLINGTDSIILRGGFLDR